MRKIKNCLKRITPSPLWLIMANADRVLTKVPYKLDMILHPDKMVYYCPCCKIRLRSFEQGDFDNYPDYYDLNAFMNVRQDLQCPFCYSWPRHRILGYWSEGHKNLFKSKRILYFAPEKSMITWLYGNYYNCTCADLDGSTDIRLDIQNMNLPDCSYDMIICNHVLEHVDDYRVALSEVYRVLTPGGYFICSFPMDPCVDLVDEDRGITDDSERRSRYGQSDHKRMFGMRADVLLSEAGFEVTVIDGNDCPSDILPVIGPSKYDMNRLFLCHKRSGQA